jgi:hypothetical protein
MAGLVPAIHGTQLRKERVVLMASANTWNRFLFSSGDRCLTAPCVDGRVKRGHDAAEALSDRLSPARR